MIRIVLVAIILISMISGGGFWLWTTSPLYSLEQLKESVRDHNLSKFQMYFSTDEVANSMVKDLIASPIRKALGGETLERFLNSGMVSPSTVQHEVASGIAGDIKMLVETGSFNKPSGSELDKASMSTLDARLGIKTISLTKIQDIKVNGNVAIVTMILHSEKFNTDLELIGEMQNKDGYWQATRIVNVVDFFNKLFELERASSSAKVNSETKSRDERESASDAEATETEK
jgi:hypothetical protein